MISLVLVQRLVTVLNESILWAQIRVNLGEMLLFSLTQVLCLIQFLLIAFSFVVMADPDVYLFILKACKGSLMCLKLLHLLLGESVGFVSLLALLVEFHLFGSRCSAFLYRARLSCEQPIGLKIRVWTSQAGR